MSQLYLSARDGSALFKLNVTQFRSPMSSGITSMQTRSMLQHFPIRCGQPDIQFTCMFRGQYEKHEFQNFVREHQVKALTMGRNNDMDVVLNWPERNIENWSGYITQFRVDERRFMTAQPVTFGVDLINSLMSTRATISSRANPFNNLLGIEIRPYDINIDGLFNLPNLVNRLNKKSEDQGLGLGR